MGEVVQFPDPLEARMERLFIRFMQQIHGEGLQQWQIEAMKSLRRLAREKRVNAKVHL